MNRLLSLCCLALISFSASTALAAGDAKHAPQQYWAFDGPLGTFDEASIQRGFQVYREVCSSCHSLERVPFRKLQEVGFSEAEVKALAAEYTVMNDRPNDDGDMFERAGRPSDYFPKAFANEQAGRAINNGAYPPDLSLMVKARHDGANYLHALLTGYDEAPEGFELSAGTYYNHYFSGHVIKMAPPLSSAGLVDYQDGTEASVDQMAYDVVNFLQWAAEPEMQERKAMGVRVMIFLLIMTAVFYVAKRRIWKNVKH